MGQQQSSESGEDASAGPFDSLAAADRAGWKVLSVAANSPASGQGVVPYFSVLTHVNGVRLATDNEASLVPLIREGVPTSFTFRELPTLQSREVSITPSRGTHDGLLGLMIRWDSFGSAHLEAIHVLEVHRGSPAEQAGLRAHSDYLLGTRRLAFKGYTQLDQFLEQHDGTEGTLLVFNRDTCSVREARITPSRTWGGAGALGCDVGVGFLHQLPIDTSKSVTYEGDSQLQQQQQAAPVQQTQPQFAPAPTVDATQPPQSTQEQQQPMQQVPVQQPTSPQQQQQHQQSLPAAPQSSALPMQQPQPQQFQPAPQQSYQPQAWTPQQPMAAPQHQSPQQPQQPGSPERQAQQQQPPQAYSSPQVQHFQPAPSFQQHQQQPQQPQQHASPQSATAAAPASGLPPAAATAASVTAFPASIPFQPYQPQSTYTPQRFMPMPMQQQGNMMQPQQMGAPFQTHEQQQQQQPQHVVHQAYQPQQQAQPQQPQAPQQAYAGYPPVVPDGVLP